MAGINGRPSARRNVVQTTIPDGAWDRCLWSVCTSRLHEYVTFGQRLEPHSRSAVTAESDW